MLFRTFLVTAALLPTIALADVSPYTGQESRSIKALSAEDVDGLLQGKGMSLALPAELNGYPGPRHALDLAAQLGLSPEQIAALEMVWGNMSTQAKRLGADIVTEERDLDGIFAAGTASPATVDAAAQKIGRLQGYLRAAHLKAHIEVRGILTARQTRRYDGLRAYSAKAGHVAPSTTHGQH